MSINWSFPARKDLHDAVEYIRRDDPNTALSVANQIFKATEQLLAFPGSGPPGQVAGTRQLVVRNLLYVIVYRVKGADIQILRVLHTRRHVPSLMK